MKQHLLARFVNRRRVELHGIGFFYRHELDILAAELTAELAEIAKLMDAATDEDKEE